MEANGSRRPSRWLLWWAIHAVLATGLWLVLSGGRGPAVGTLAIAGAAATPLLLGLPQTRRLSLRGLAIFVAFFLTDAVRGAVDVSARALGPRARVHAGWMRYRTRLPPGTPTTLFVAAMNLLPGTLGVALFGRELHVHTLGGDRTPQLAALEDRVARLFRIPTEGAKK